jgi:hypothetical protein
LTGIQPLSSAPVEGRSAIWRNELGIGAARG